jgi:glycogen(starch) synthase
VRILFVNGHGVDTRVGGTERYVSDLERGCRARGLETAVLSAFPGGEGPPAGVRAETLHRVDWRSSRSRRLRNHLGSYDARATKRLRAAVVRAAPDLVHTNNLAGITTGIWGVCGELGIPIVHALHDYSLLCARTTLLSRDGEPCRPSPLGCGLRAKRSARWARSVGAVIGVSRHVIRAHEEFFPPDTPTHVVLHARPAPSVGADVPRPERLQTLGYIGNLDITKGVGALLDAAEPLRALGIRIRIAGDGRLRTRVEEAAAAGLLDYEGMVEGSSKERFLEACDAGAVPSIWAEPGAPPFTALEWLASRRPVICSTRGGLREAAESFPGMIPVEPNADAVVAACSRLLDREAWRGAVDAAALPISSGRDDERWLAEHLRIYEGLVARR